MRSVNIILGKKSKWPTPKMADMGKCNILGLGMPQRIRRVQSCDFGSNCSEFMMQEIQCAGKM